MNNDREARNDERLTWMRAHLAFPMAGLAHDDASLLLSLLDEARAEAESNGTAASYMQNSAIAAQNFIIKKGIWDEFLVRRDDVADN